MKIIYRTIGVTVVSVALVLTTGCVNPDGTQNNTGTGAFIGALTGAVVGGLTGNGRDAATRAMIGGVAGAIAGGLVGNMIDQQQQQRLQQQSPQTWNKLQNNDAVYASSPSPSTPSAAAAPPPSTPPAATSPQMQQFTVDDIKALTKSGVKPDAITKEIDISQSKFSQADITAAQQANPAIDPAVIAYIQSHAS